MHAVIADLPQLINGPHDCALVKSASKTTNACTRGKTYDCEKIVKSIHCDVSIHRRRGRGRPGPFDGRSLHVSAHRCGERRIRPAEGSARPRDPNQGRHAAERFDSARRTTRTPTGASSFISPCPAMSISEATLTLPPRRSRRAWSTCTPSRASSP